MRSRGRDSITHESDADLIGMPAVVFFVATRGPDERFSNLEYRYLVSALALAGRWKP
jgi:hypothetical protein